MNTSNSTRSTTDTVRSVALIAAVAVAITAGAWGSGMWGATPVDQVADGALAEDATVLAPASMAFMIWSVIYTGLTVYGVVHAFARFRSDPRMRHSAWLVAGASVLSAAWIGLVQAEALWASTIAIAAMVVLLGIAMGRLGDLPPTSWTHRLCVDLPLGLFLGWSCVALVAGIAASGAASIDDHQAGDGEVLGAVVLVGVGALAVVLARRLRGSAVAGIAVGLALAWGLWGIAHGRLQGEPSSLLVGWSAGIAAALAFGAPFAVRDFSMVGKKDPLTPR